MKKTIGMIVLSLGMGMFCTLGCKKQEPAKPAAPKPAATAPAAPKTTAKKADAAAADAVKKAAEKAPEAPK
jgi:hypothetical protein